MIDHYLLRLSIYKMLLFFYVFSEKFDFSSFLQSYHLTFLPSTRNDSIFIPVRRLIHKCLNSAGLKLSEESALLCAVESARQTGLPMPHSRPQLAIGKGSEKKLS